MSEHQPFTALQKLSAASFVQHKRLIKQVLAGKQVNCANCGQPLLVKTKQASQQIHILCHKGCTDILLDL
jgi:DNA-directed RNA polymerase subunit RPC12/RpoP